MLAGVILILNKSNLLFIAKICNFANFVLLLKAFA